MLEPKTLNYVFEIILGGMLATIAFFIKGQYQSIKTSLNNIDSKLEVGTVQRAEILKDVINIQEELKIIKNELDKHSTIISHLTTSVARLEEWRKYLEQYKNK